MQHTSIVGNDYVALLEVHNPQPRVLRTTPMCDNFAEKYSPHAFCACVMNTDAYLLYTISNDEC